MRAEHKHFRNELYTFHQYLNAGKKKLFRFFVLVCRLENRTCDCIKWQPIEHVNMRKRCNLRNSVAFVKTSNQNNGIAQKKATNIVDDSNSGFRRYLIFPWLAVIITMHTAVRKKRETLGIKMASEQFRNHAKQTM